MGRHRDRGKSVDEEIALQSEIRRELDRNYKHVFQSHGSSGIPLKDLHRELLKTGVTSQIPKEQVDRLINKANTDGDAFINYEEFVTLMSGEDALSRRYRKQINGFIEAAIENIVPYRKREDFLANYTCCPPPLFMVSITLAEIAVFIYYIFELKKIDQPVTWTRVFTSAVPSYMIQLGELRSGDISLTCSCIKGYLHLIFNCIFQILLGLPLEFVHKFWRVFLIYILGVLAGSLAHSVTDRFMFLAGASGGCYALIGAHIAAIIVNWKEMNYKCWEGSFLRMLLSAPVRITVLLVLVVTDTGSAIYRRYTVPGGTKVGISAHLGGMLAGLLLGVPIMKNINELPWERTLGLVTAAIYILFTVIAVLINGLYSDYPKADSYKC